jgi:hypothetical protein
MSWSSHFPPQAPIISKFPRASTSPFYTEASEEPSTSPEETTPRMSQPNLDTPNPSTSNPRQPQASTSSQPRRRTATVDPSPNEPDIDDDELDDEPDNTQENILSSSLLGKGKGGVTEQIPDAAKAEIELIFKKTLSITIKRMHELFGKDVPTQDIDLTITEEMPWVDCLKVLFFNVMPSEEAKVRVGVSEGDTILWARPKEMEQLPWGEAFKKYANLDARGIEEWKDVDIFYPFPLYHYEGTPTGERFKQHAEYAITKWRSPGTLLPRIYPKEKQHKEGIVLESLTTPEHEFLEKIWKTLSFNRVTGINEQGGQEVRYFIVLSRLGKLKLELEKLRKKISQPFFPLPQFGASQRMINLGMTKLEAQQISALFRVELEACLLEIWSYINPSMSNSIFLSRRNDIWNISMPFWSQGIPTGNEEQPDQPSMPNLHPFITTRKGRRNIPPPIREEEPYEYSETVRQPNLSDHSLRRDSRNLHSHIAAQRVGTSQTPNPRSLNVGRGRLRESITGIPQFHNTSYNYPMSNMAADASFYGNVRLDEESIHIEDLPNSQQDPNENNQYGPPGGDPNDPDDDDDNGPPGRGPPGGGPPRGGPGGNPNPWRPRFPGGPYGAPGGAPPGGPPGGGPPHGGGGGWPQNP